LPLQHGKSPFQHANPSGFAPKPNRNTNQKQNSNCHKLTEKNILLAHDEFFLFFRQEPANIQKIKKKPTPDIPKNLQNRAKPLIVRLNPKPPKHRKSIFV